jgi:hypothetical protein
VVVASLVGVAMVGVSAAPAHAGAANTRVTTSAVAAASAGDLHSAVNGVGTQSAAAAAALRGWYPLLVNCIITGAAGVRANRWDSYFCAGPVPILGYQLVTNR